MIEATVRVPAGQSAVDLSWSDGPATIALLQDEWQALARKTRADIYLHPEWCGLWWKHFGAGRHLTCIIARQEGELVGLLPFCIDTIRLGPVAFRIARLAGTDPNCIVFTLPVLPHVADAVLAGAVDRLLGVCKCDAISLTPLTKRADFLPSIDVLRTSRIDLAVAEQVVGSHIMFDLGSGFDSHLSKLSRNRRSDFRGSLRSLETRFAVTSRVVVPDATEFSDFAAFHNRQWQAIGKGGHFVDWPGSAAFYTELAAISSPDWGVRLDVLEGSDGDSASVPMAAIFSLVSGETCHARLPARTMGIEAQRMGIGKVSLMLAIRNAITSGYRQIEAGRGEYDYKLSLGGRTVPVHRLLIARSASRMPLRLLTGWADLLHLVYYRIWFQRLAPRLRRLTGMRPRPLWRLWIRTRL